MMRAEELEHDGETGEAMPQPGEEINLTMAESSRQPSFGQRLRAAREAKGLSRADVAARLKLPLRLVGRLEDDNYAGMDEGVYLRGYLSSYARMVDVPTVAAETVAAQNTRSAPLVATGKISRSRYLFDRYSVSATYLILTGLIVVPAVWLATHGGLEQNLARTTSLDSPTTTIQVPAQQSESIATTPSGDSAASAPAGESAPSASDTTPTATVVVDMPKQEQPVVASMTPFATTPQAPAPTASTAQAGGAHSLTLKLSGASWVEILAADGSKLEYGLLPVGAERSYSSNGPMSVRLGNAEGAEISVDGKAIDLAPFRRANVARLHVGENGVEAPRADF